MWASPRNCSSSVPAWACAGRWTTSVPGYSTLTYLKRLPVRVLKIDRLFVQNMLTDAQDGGRIIEGDPGPFGSTQVAEGIGQPQSTLLDIGCDVGQGRRRRVADAGRSRSLAWVQNWRGLFTLSSTPAAPAADRHATARPTLPR